MKIDISDIKKSKGLSRFIHLDDLQAPCGLDLTSPLVSDLKLTNAGSRILVQGRLRTSLRLVCSRCADEYVQVLEVEVDEQFLPADSPEVPRGEDLDLEDLSVFTYEHETIDLSEVIRQNLLAESPIKPLCRQDCRGLCPQCGTNLNEGSCTCTDEEVEPRWAALSEIQARIEQARRQTN